MPSRWPTQLEYQEAIEFPTICFADPELRFSVVADRTPFGLPRPVTGQFSNVYRMLLPKGQFLAVRLFLFPMSERKNHWEAIENHFATLPTLPRCLARTHFLTEGIFVGGVAYPLLKMPWLRGIPLNLWIDKNLYDREALLRLANHWLYVVNELDRVRFVHGDLQHGNILVEEETEAIHLVDYDAAFVPALAGTPNRETGHPAYQHPARSVENYGSNMDNFSALVIYTGLRVLAVAPELWFRLDNGDNFLFRKEDFQEPEKSRAFALMQETLRTRLQERFLVNQLKAVCHQPFSHVPSLQSFLATLPSSDAGNTIT